MSMLASIDFQNPTTYPKLRDEEWKYTNLSQALLGLEIGTHISTDQTSLKVDNNLIQWVDDLGTGISHNIDTIEIGEGAQLSRVIAFQPQSVALRQLEIVLKPNSHLKLVILATGSQLSRLEIIVDHQGDGAICEINCAYILKNKEHFDLTTRVIHSAGKGITTQLVKGLVKDQAMGVFQGCLIVAKGSDGTDARMHHQSLLLNDGAKVRAKPELEIYADDVACAHGNTVGAIDEMALFFCQSRGMDEITARNMLMQAFLVPICDTIIDDGHKEKANEWLNVMTARILGIE